MDPRTDVLTGINYSDTQALKADTQQRLDQLFSSIPNTNQGLPTIPVGQSGAVVNNGTNINIDPEQVKQNVRAQAYKNFQDATKKQAVFADTSFYQQKDTRRYIDEEWGFNPRLDNEDFYAKQQGQGLLQGTKEYLKAVLFKLPILTAAKIGQGAGFLAGLVNPVNWGSPSNWIAAASDNWFAQQFTKLEDNVKNDWMPVYQEAADRDKGFFARAFTDQNFWTEDMVDGVAFLASAFVPGATVSKLNLGAKIIGAAKAATAAEAAGDAAAYLSSMNKGITANKFLTTALNTASESMFEAIQIKNDMYDDLIKQGMSHNQAMAIIGPKMRDSFLFNVMALSLSNSWETNLFYKALGKAPAAAVRKDLAGTLLTEAYALTKPATKIGQLLETSLGYYGKKALEGIGVEGFWEENIQLAIQRMNEGGKKGILDQYFSQTIDAIKGDDQEASMSIGMGATIGAIFGTGTSMFNREYSKEKAQEEGFVRLINDARNDWIKAVDIYQRAPDGTYDLDTGKLASITFNQLKNSMQVSDAEALKNPHLREIYKKDALASFISAHVKHGTFDIFLKQLAGAKDFKPEELAALGFNPDNNTTDQIAEYTEYAHRVKAVRDNVDSVPTTDRVDGIRHEMLFEKGALVEAIKMESSKVGRKISDLSLQMGAPSLSDSVVESLNLLKQKRDIYNGNKDKVDDKPFYESQIDGLDAEIARLKIENEETLKNIKKDKNGFYLFEKDERNKSPFTAQYMQNLTTNASLGNALDEAYNEFDKINTNQEYVEKKIQQDVELAKKAQQEAVAAEQAREKKQAEDQRAKKAAEDAKKNPVAATSAQPSTTDKPVTKPVDVKPTPTIAKPVIEIPTLSAEEILAKIPPTDYIDAELKSDLSVANNKGFAEGRIPEALANEIANILGNKNVVGTMLDTNEQLVKGIALRLFRKQPLNNDQKATYMLFKNQVDAELNNILQLAGTNVPADDTSDLTAVNTQLSSETSDDQENILPWDEDPIGDHTTDKTPVSDQLPVQVYDPIAADEEEMDLEFEPSMSLVAYYSSLKTVTQEEDEDTNKLVKDPYIKFKQGFLRNLLDGTALASDEFSGALTQDKPEYPRPIAAQEYLDAGGEYGAVLIITNNQGQRLYFDKNYNYITSDEYDSRLTGTLADENTSPVSSTHQLLVYAFNKDAWNQNVDERIMIASERLEVDPAIIAEQYQKEDEFLKLARQLIEKGYSPRVRITQMVPGAIRRGKEAKKASDILTGFNYSLQIVSGTEEDQTHVIVGGRYLVNGGLYAVVQQQGEPDFYVRLTPNKLSHTEMYEDVKSLIDHTYDNEKDIDLVNKYLSNLLYLGKQRKYELVSIEKDGKFTFGFKNKGQFQNNTQGIHELLNASRFNVDRSGVDTDVFRTFFIQDGKLKHRNISNYSDFLVKNSTTYQLPYIQDGNAVFRALNTYAIFAPHEANQALLDVVTDYNPQIQPRPEKSPEQTTDSSTLTTDKVTQKRKRIDVGEESANEVINRLKRDIDQSTEEDLNLPLAALKTTERRALIGENEIQKVNQMFGKKILENLSNVANSGMWAEWTAYGTRLFKGAQEGTGYHEAWHHFSQLYLNKKQKRSLYDEIRTRALDFTSRTGRKLNTRTASDFDIEEFTADDFRDYVLNNGTSRLAKRPARNTIFRDILRFLKEFLFGTVDVSHLYEQLYQGDLANYKPSVKNAMWGKLTAGVYNSQGVELFDTVKASYYNSVLDSLVAKQLLDAGASTEQIRVDANDSDKTKAKKLEFAGGIYEMVRRDLYKNYYTPQADKYDAGDNSTESFLTDLETILENWVDIAAFHAKNSKLDYYITEEIPYVDVEETDTNESEEDQSDINEINKEDQEGEFAGKLFDRSGNETNGAVTAPQEIRSIVRMLPAMIFDGEKFVADLDQNGFPKLNDYSKTWNNLAYQLNGSLSYSEMYRRLSKPEVQQKVPQAQELLRRLVDPNKGEPNLIETTTATRFYAAFSRDYIGIFSGSFIKGPNRYYFLEETKRTADLIQRNWNNRFLQHTEETTYFKNGDIIFDTNLDRYALNPDKKYTFNFQSVIDTNYFLGLLGIQFSPVARVNSIVVKMLPNILTSIQNNINLRQAAGQVLFNPLLDLKQDLRREEKIKGVSGEITVLARQEAEYSTDTPSMSYHTAEGEMIHALSLRNFLSTSVGALNSASNYQELISTPEFAHYDVTNNPYVRYSVFMNTMFDLTTGARKTVVFDGKVEPVQMILGNYNGLKIEGTKKIASSNTSLNPRQKLIFDLNSLLTKGSIEIMRTESSSGSFFMKLNTYHNRTNHPVKFTEFSNSFRSPAFMEKIVNYLAMELYRIKNFETETDVSQSIKDASKGFYYFRDILRLPDDPESLKNKLKAGIQTSEIADVIEANRPAIEERIENFFEDQFNSMRRLMASENVTADDLDRQSLKTYDDDLNQVIRGFVANSFIFNTEFIILFDGDLVYQKDYKDYFKRAKGDVSTGKTPMTDNIFANFMRKIDKATFAGFLGSSHLNDYRTVRTANIEDYKTTSSYVDHGIIESNLKAVNPNITQKQIDKILEKYKDLNVADGQGHITLDFYRQFLKSISNWTIDQEITYQKELAWFRLNYSNHGTTYSEGQRARDEAFLVKNADVNSYFPPLKIQYNGPIKASGTFAKVLDKFSVAPLIPSIVRGTRWENINIDLIKNGIGYTKFVSGTKKYKHPAVKMYKDGDVSINFTDYKPAVHFLVYLKEQINTSPKIKKDSTFGSQVRKLILANLFSKGTSSEKNVKRLEKYNNLIKDVVNIEKGRLFDEIGLKTISQQQYLEDPKYNASRNTDITSTTVTVVDDIRKFVQTLQRQAELRDLNDNIKHYIQYDKDTNLLRNPLEASLNRPQIQDMIMGIIDNRLRRLKINGDQLIQISSAGFESNAFKYKAQTREEVEQNGTNGLKFYTLELDKDGKPIRTNPMEIKVALAGGFENLLNMVHPEDKRLIGTLDRLNALLKDKDWVEKHQKAVTMIGYRIPTQGPNSIEFMRVAEFLPSNAGSSIILPAEIVAKAGSDYDIDKMFVFRPSFNSDGSMVNSNTTNDDDKKSYLTNSIIELFQDIMSDPEMYQQMITPNNVDLVKPPSIEIATAIGKRRAKEAKPYEGTQILRYINNLRKFESLLSGKKLLGIFAVNNTFSQLMQQGGVGMNVFYGKGRAKVAKLFLLSPQERKQALSEDGRRIDLSHSTDVTGVYKQEYFSQLINATVDVPSDDFIGYVNLSYENAGVVSLLIHQRVPFERALWFVNQPAMIRYYTMLRAKAGERNRQEIQADILTSYGVTGLFDKKTGRLFYDKLATAIQATINNSQITDAYYLPLAYLKLAANNRAYAEEIAKSDLAKKAAFRANEKIAFAYFLSLQEQAQHLQNFRSVLNYDTTKFGTPIEVVSSFEKEKTLTDPKEGNGMFNKEDVDAIAKNSVISAFSNKKLIWQIAQSIMPVGYNARFLAKAARKIGKIYGRKNTQRAAKIMSNDWIEYIIKNFGIRNGVPIRTLQEQMGGGKRSIAKRLIIMKAKYPELADRYVFFARMKPNLPTGVYDRTENLEIQRVFENTTADQNRYIAEFRELINFKSDLYNEAQLLEIQNFFRDAALYAFIQSGFNKSNISFQELVPDEVLSEVFNIAITDFMEKLAPNKALTDDFIDMFVRKFENTHKKLFYSRANYNPTWRGINYNIQFGLFPQLDAMMPQVDLRKDEVKRLPDRTVDTVAEVIKSEINETPTTTILAPVVKPVTRAEEIRSIFSTSSSFKEGLSGVEQELTPDIIQKLLDAHMRIWNEAKKPYIVYLKFTKDMTEAQKTEIWENSDRKDIKAKYVGKLNLSTFEDMLSYYDTDGDEILQDNGETSLDSIIDNYSAVLAETSNNLGGIEFESISYLYNSYMTEANERSEQEDMKRTLLKYGIPLLEDAIKTDPNQLNLFEPTIGALSQPAPAVTQPTTKDQAMSYKMPAGENLTGKDTTTLELAEQGLRTATTRSNPLGKVGDIVTFEGRPQKYRITALEQLTPEKVGDPMWIRDWSLKEQWTMDHFRDVLGGGTVHVGSWQTSFERVNEPKSTSKVTFEQDTSTNYASRTNRNAGADATIAIAVNFNTAGEKATKTAVTAQKKRYIPVDISDGLKFVQADVDRIVEHLNDVKAKSLNIAGNGIFSLPGVYTQADVDSFTLELLKAVLNSPKLKTKIISVVTGGQTGFDEAGAKASIQLGIPTIIRAPKGWKFRDITGTDISDEAQFKARFTAPGTIANKLGIQPNC